MASASSSRERPPRDAPRHLRRSTPTLPPLPAFENERSEPPILLEKKPRHKVAIVTLVMKGDRYVPGAMALAYSIRKIEGRRRRVDLVCMVTEDVTRQGRDNLEIVFDHVVDVPYLAFRTNFQPQANKKVEDYYKPWSATSYTKWQCLALMDYEKVLFLDSDMVVVHSVMDLFELDAPALNFSSPYFYPYVSTSRAAHNHFLTFNKNKKKWVTRQHGQQIYPDEVIRALFDTSSVAYGSVVLLEPSMDHYHRYLNLMENPPDPRGYGFVGNKSMVDEQSICELYARQNLPMTFISQSYNFIPWKINWLKTEKFPPRIFHYFSIKPWMPEMDRSQYEDQEVFWLTVENMLERFPHLRHETYRFEENGQPKENPYFPEPALEYGRRLKEENVVSCIMCKLMKRSPAIVHSHNILKNGRPHCDVLTMNTQQWRRLYTQAYGSE